MRDKYFQAFMGNEKWTSRPLEAENMVSPTQKIKFGLVQMPQIFFPFLKKNPTAI